MNPSFIDNIPRKNASWAEYFIFPLISRGAFKSQLDLFLIQVFRDSLEKSRLKTVVNFLVNIQSRRGLDGLLELRDYLHKLKKELGSKADSK
jgi:hypothetical protein